MQNASVDERFCCGTPGRSVLLGNRQDDTWSGPTWTSFSWRRHAGCTTRCGEIRLRSRHLRRASCAAHRGTARARDCPDVRPRIRAPHARCCGQRGVDQESGPHREAAGVPIADANLVTAGLGPTRCCRSAPIIWIWLGTGFNDENNAGPPEYSARVDFLFERGDKRGAAHRRWHRMNGRSPKPTC